MNKTRKIEMTVELIRILVAVGIAYAIALVTLFLISEDPVYIIQQFVLGPFSSVRRVGSIINQAIPFVFTGLCFCFMYAVNKFNLAGEGIFMFAGCMSTLVAVNLGEGLPFLMERIENRIKFLPNPALQCHQDLRYYFRNNIWVTTSGNMSKEAFQCTKDVLGTDRILFASDYPFESIEDMMAFLGQLPLSQEETEQLYFRNAETALGIPQL